MNSLNETCLHIELLSVVFFKSLTTYKVSLHINITYQETAILLPGITMSFFCVISFLYFIVLAFFV